MLKLASELEALGVLVAGIRPPTVPRGTSRLRISLSCAHGEEGIEALQSAFAKVRTSRRLEETAGVGAPLGS
jgi:8-amino-7-oxononanoate synthase